MYSVSRVTEIVSDLIAGTHQSSTAEERSDVLTHLRQLQPDHRTVVGLLFYGYTTREVAQMTRRSKSTINALYRRALITLTERLNG